jgi:glutamate:GABA antiporter
MEIDVVEARTTAKPKGGIFRQVLSRLDLMLFSVCAILILDGLGASAAIGVASLTWYIIILVLFFIPYGLIIAELGTTYPDQGGIFIWIGRAFGTRWAARATWCYWVCVPLGIPSVYILFAGILSQLFFQQMGRVTSMMIAILLTWITVGVGLVRLEVGRWIPNLGAVVKAIVLLALGMGGILFSHSHGSANNFSLSSLAPHWNSGLAFLPVVIFNFLGFELVSGAGDEIRHPDQNVSTAIIISGGIIAFFYLFATLGILLAVPLKKLSLMNGIIQTLQIVLGSSAMGGVLVDILGVGVLATLFGTMVTWTLGTNRSIAQAASEGSMPGILGRLDRKRKTPIGAALIGGCLSTVVLVAYGMLSGSIDQYFWKLFAFASIVFLLPYLLLFPAFLKLRHSDPTTRRPYRFPGGKVLAWCAATICMLFIIQAVVFFIWVPGLPVDWSFALPVLAGIVVTLIGGEILILIQT